MEDTLEGDIDGSRITQTGLLSIPEEVLYRCIFPYLRFEDLLRLRRVCKPILLFASDFVRNNYKSHVREINETNFTFQHYLQANLPTTSIYLNNSSSSSFFDHPDVPTFLNLYGDKIISLKINHFATCLSPSELHFFSNLPNLLHLDIIFVDATKRNCMYTYRLINGVKVLRESCPFPQSFKNLKTLKLNEIQGSERMDQGYAYDFIEFCENLEYVKHPLYKNMIGGMSTHPGGPFGCVMDYIKKRQQLNPNGPNLKFYDLAHFEETEFYAFKFVELVELCYKHNVKLMNVHSDLLDMANLFREKPEVLTNTLVSLRNVHGYSFHYELPFLEELVVESTAKSSFAESWVLQDADNMEDFAPKWPSLKKLKLTIDSDALMGSAEIRERETQDLIDFLFLPENWKRRDELAELGIRFCKRSREYGDSWPFPRARNITQSCRFVRKLSLGNWLGGNKEIYRFWEGFQLLEEVELEECRGLGDVAFVGKKWHDPVFLKLKKLKKVSLKGLDKMPKLTDQVFKLVFSRLKVKQFCLSSERPLKSITPAGIESLIDGDFNNYVERFPFDTWSLDGVSEDAFTNLKLKFRATSMI